jgi:hypothetical protein
MSYSNRFIPFEPMVPLAPHEAYLSPEEQQIRAHWHAKHHRNRGEKRRLHRIAAEAAQKQRLLEQQLALAIPNYGLEMPSFNGLGMPSFIDRPAAPPMSQIMGSPYSSFELPPFLNEDECELVAKEFHDAIMSELGEEGSLSVFPSSPFSATNKLLEESRQAAQEKTLAFNAEPERQGLEKQLETHEHLTAKGMDGSTYERIHSQSQDQEGNLKHILIW